jgi:ubiquinone biosynthesis protein COQ4
MMSVSENPDDTASAIRAIAAMSGQSQQRCFKRFRRTERGRRLLEQRPELFDRMNDLDYLLGLPEDTLGHAIGTFYATEEISAQGLKDASEAAGGRQATNTDFDWFARRSRDLHDVFHVLTGYGRDIRGEGAVLAFTAAQTWHTGIGYLAFRLLRGSGWNSEQGKLIRQAFRRGLSSDWLVDQDWETLLEQPLVSLRERLGVGPAPVYEQLRSAGAPVLN